ncbi:MAG: hypothetical protein M1830_002223 [Pleopsidium flavum]|nr:MAG: hypothetical protein M1830_002223 [Pleopsidium flavum]
MRAEDIPDFKDLPSVPGMPQGCAWGIWDKNGERDHVGSLNLLTPEIVLEAKREIQTGVSVSLKWATTSFTSIRRAAANGMAFREEWSKRGGIVGRAVLIDYASWAEQKGIQYSAISRHCISENDLDDIAKDQGVHFRPGDILIVRSGWVKWYNNATASERIKGAKDGHEFIGVKGTESSIEWLWNHHFAAIAGDAIAF